MMIQLDVPPEGLRVFESEAVSAAEAQTGPRQRKWTRMWPADSDVACAGTRMWPVPSADCPPIMTDFFYMIYYSYYDTILTDYDTIT